MSTSMEVVIMVVRVASMVIVVVLEVMMVRNGS
jgi:hypothetical protein